MLQAHQQRKHKKNTQVKTPQEAPQQPQKKNKAGAHAKKRKLRTELLMDV